jgi:Uma2 family endonuclease
MKAVIAHVSERELAERRRTGHDRWDEMWEGVLHMAPAPSYEHQRILDALIVFLSPLLESGGRGVLRSGVNVFGQRTGTESYRIPDLTFVARGRESIIAADGIRGGAPDAVIEIRSPDDETEEKLPFFAALGVAEVIVIDRDTKQPTVYRLVGTQLVALLRDPGGWVASEKMDVRWKHEDADLDLPKLIVCDRTEPSRFTEI